MKSNYRPIDDFIELVDVRNKDLRITKLLGLSITKEFIPSVANTVGTDMANYKVIKKNQFACSIMQVRRDKKMPIALLKDFDDAIISQAYPIFEIINESELLPDYLMMWFSRAEFDRHACFLAVGGVRGSLEWEDFLEMELPVPSIEKQREIVKEYNTIVNRIKINEQLNQKLEETAQALYKHWFVDFEFPDENGQPYKSSGGKLVLNEELEQEIPEGWKVTPINGVASLTAGGDKPKSYSFEKTDDLNVPIYSNTTINEGVFGYTDSPKVFDESITVSARGAIIGYTVLRKTPFFPIVRLIVITPFNKNTVNYLYETICRFEYDDSGSAQGQLTVPQISKFSVLVPDKKRLDVFQGLTSIFIENIKNRKNQLNSLIKLKRMLLLKMSNVEVLHTEKAL